jgi:hypothetical protein
MAAGMRLRLMTNGSPTPHVHNPIKTGRGQSGWRSWYMIGAGMQADVEWGAPRFCQCGDPMFAFSRGLLHRNTKASHQSPQSPVRRRQSIASVHRSSQFNRSQLGRYGLPRGAQRSTAQHAHAQAQRLPRIVPARVASCTARLRLGEGAGRHSAAMPPWPCRCQRSTAA